MDQSIEQQFEQWVKTHHPELLRADKAGMKEPEDFHGRRIIPTPYQEFPKVMYSPTGERPIVAMKKKEQERLEDEGWSTKPFPGHVINADGSITVPPVETKEEAKKAN